MIICKSRLVMTICKFRSFHFQHMSTIFKTDIEATTKSHYNPNNVKSGENKVYPDLTSYLRDKEVIPDRYLAQGKSLIWPQNNFCTHEDALKF